MKKSAYVSDLIFAFVCIFLPCLCFLRFKRIPLGWATLVSALLGFSVCLWVERFLRNKYQKSRLKTYEKREADALSLHLALMKEEEQVDFICRYARVFFPKECDCLYPIKHLDKTLLLTDSSVIYAHFSLAPLLIDTALPLLSYLVCNPKERNLSTTENCTPPLLEGRTAVLVCSGVDENARALLEKFSVNILDIFEIYSALKEADALPKEALYGTAIEKKQKRRFQLWTQKRNARPFLTGGALLLISSLFSPFPYYYLLMGCLMVGASACVRIFGR